MNRRTLLGARVLFGAWGVLGAGVASTAAVLEVLGPPTRSTHGFDIRRGVPEPTSPVGMMSPSSLPVHAPGTIAPPDPALLASVPDQPRRMLPVIGADGSLPLATYAATRVPVLPNQARLALLVDGIGLDEATSAAAIAQLPPPVSLAFSPYADAVAPLAAAARARGHEMLASIPMEPQGSPQSDEGDRQLSASNDDATNQRNLAWALSSLQGYVGATAAETGQAGEHVLGDSVMLADVTRTLAARGLMFVDPRPGASMPAGVSSVVAGAVIDGQADLVDQEAQLGALVALAQRDGRALGIVGPLRPVTLARLVAWVRTLPAQGVVLVPASSLAARPATQLTETAPAGVGQ